jgi:zinc transporter, ZIP family
MLRSPAWTGVTPSPGAGRYPEGSDPFGPRARGLDAQARSPERVMPSSRTCRTISRADVVGDDTPGPDGDRAVGEAIAWGLVAGASLVLGALAALRFRPTQHINGLIMAFGAGVLISAVAYELVEEALGIGASRASLALGLGAGAFTFYFGDLLIDRAGGEDRKGSEGSQAEGSSLAIALGAVLDGVPESIVLGLSLLTGEGVSVALLAAVFISNIPESIAATTGLSRSGWPRGRILIMWTAIAAVSGLSAGLGYGIFANFSNLTGAFAQAFAAGAMLTMLADTMMPEAFRYGGKRTGLLTVLGFATAVGISAVG